MQECVSHKLSLKRRFLAKHKHKTSSQTSTVIVEPEVFDGDAPPAVMAPSMSPVVTTASTANSAPQIVDQVKLMFVRIDNRFNQFSANSASPVSIINVSCQDATNISLPASSPVAVLSERPTDRGPCALYSDGLGSSLGGLASVSTSVDATSLPHMTFAEMLDNF